MYPVKSTRMFFGTSAERTAAGLASFLPGDGYYETDTSDTYQHNGTAWTQKNTGGGGTPGGSSGQVQYNDGGAFGGDAGFTWNNSTDLLSVVGGFALSNTSTADPVTASMSSEIDTQFFTFARQSFFAKNDAGEDVEYVRFDYNITDETDGDEGASFIIYRRINGTLAAVLSMSETTNEIAGNTYITGNLYAGLSGNLASITDTGIVFNSGEDDVDFRIAGDGVTNGVFFDASSSRLGLGTSTPGSTLHVSGGSISLDNEYVIQAKDTGGTLRSIFQLNNANNAIIGFGVQSGNSVRIAPGGTARVTIEATTGNVGIGTTAPAASAKLEISSTTGALLLPRMTTTQRNALTAVNGMIIYNTTTGVIEGYEGGAWVNL